MIRLEDYNSLGRKGLSVIVTGKHNFEDSSIYSGPACSTGKGLRVICCCTLGSTVICLGEEWDQAGGKGIT